MKILDWYIIKKFLGTFFYAIALLSIIIIIFDVAEKTDDFLENKPSLFEIVFNYYANFIPFFVNMFSSLFTFISVIFFTSKMASNTEIIAILGNGISFNRMLKPYMIAAFILALFSFGLSNFVIPETSKSMQEFSIKYLRTKRKSMDYNVHMQIDPGVFVFVENYNSKMKEGSRFTLESFNNDGMQYKLHAEYLRWDTVKGNVILENWVMRKIYPDHEVLTRGNRMDTIIDLQPSDFLIDVDDAAYMNFGELNRFIEKEKLRGSASITKFIVEKHKRIAYPFATIILTLIGVSLSSRKTRGGIGLHLGIGVTIAFAFILFMQISTVFAIYGNLPPVVAVWIPNVLFGLLSIYLIKIAPK